MLERAGGAWLVVRLPVDEQGLELLRGSWASNVQAYLLRLVTDVRRAARAVSA